jgi:hypothetical protein
MRRNYVALMGFLLGVVGTIVMYELRFDPGQSTATTDARFLSASDDASMTNAGDPI